MVVFDHLAYLFALIIHAPLPVEAAVVMPPPQALAMHYNAAPRVTTILTHPLPPLHGDAPKLQVVEVRYGPGESSQPHTHPCPVVGYVLEGSVRMQVKGSPERTYSAGESFYEAPNGVHLVSENASKTRPARFLATFLCDHEGPLSTPVHSTHGGR
jgi:quercetin dioxygenase-like cupin family protein